VTFKVTAALAAIQGGRKAQEDTALLWPGDASGFGSNDTKPLPDGHLLAVLGDGMGGHVGGAMASQVATAAFVQTFCNGYEVSARLMERFIMTLDETNAALGRKVEERPMYNGMGTTLIGALIAPFELGSALSWISVGDSLLYLWRRGDLARLNEDHSLAPELDKLAEAGKMTWDEAQADPRRHYLRSAMTGADIEMIDVTPRPLPLAAGDVVVIATDGIHSLDDSAIARIIDQTRSVGAEAIANRLVQSVEVLKYPNQDNTTVIAIVIGDDAP
jgi:PPM family protein phosphatase